MSADDGLWHSLFHSLAFSEASGLGELLDAPLSASSSTLDAPLSASSSTAALPPGARPNPQVDVLPRYTSLWPGQDACETCIRTRRRYLCDHCAGAKPPVERWLSLELVLLGRFASSSWPEMAARTQHLVRQPPEHFHCYRELLGGPGSFYPRILAHGPFRNYSELQAARPRVLAFRRRIWAHAGILLSRSPPHVAAARVLFVLRRESRAVVNERQLQDATAADPHLARMVHFVRMEQAGPLAAQIALVASSSAIAGVHGQGLSLIPFLPAHVRRCALLEIRPRQMSRQSTHAGFDLMRWAMMSDVRFFVLKAADTRECKDEDFRLCGNVTANIPEVLEALHSVRRHVIT